MVEFKKDYLYKETYIRKDIVEYIVIIVCTHVDENCAGFKDISIEKQSSREEVRISDNEWELIHTKEKNHKYTLIGHKDDYPEMFL